MTERDPTPVTAPLARELEFATRLARTAGEILVRHRRVGVRAGSKHGGEIVTEADLEADRAIRAGIERAFPDDAILSEEIPDHPRRLTARRVWIIDPIDGTQDFADGGDEHGISIGLVDDAEAVLGIVHNPARGELFAGARGLGLTLDGRRAAPTGMARVADAALTVSGTEWAAGAYAGAQGLRLRPLSSAAYKLARVAAGLDDGTFWIWPRKEWDVCAGVALVLAAGGSVSLLAGRPVSFNRPDVRLDGGLIASGAALHEPLLAELRRQGLLSTAQV